MVPFTYRCPRTGLQVQGWTADDPTNGETYEPVTCIACGRIHLVNPKSAKPPHLLVQEFPVVLVHLTSPSVDHAPNPTMHRTSVAIRRDCISSVPPAMPVPSDAHDDHDRDHHYSNRRHDASVCETPHVRHSKVYTSGSSPNRFVRRTSFIR
jgi:hypothetical protein